MEPERCIFLPGKFTEQGFARTFKNVCSLLEAAAAHGADHLILSALGCGAFGNPPKQAGSAVAMLVAAVCFHVLGQRSRLHPSSKQFCLPMLVLLNLWSSPSWTKSAHQMEIFRSSGVTFWEHLQRSNFNRTLYPFERCSYVRSFAQSWELASIALKSTKEIAGIQKCARIQIVQRMGTMFLCGDTSSFVLIRTAELCLARKERGHVWWAFFVKA